MPLFVAMRGGTVVGGKGGGAVEADSLSVAPNGTLCFLKDGREIDGLRPGAWEAAFLAEADGRTPAAVLDRGSDPRAFGGAPVEIETRGTTVPDGDWRKAGPDLLYVFADAASLWPGGAAAIGRPREDGGLDATFVAAAGAWRHLSFHAEGGVKKMVENRLYIAAKNSDGRGDGGRDR